MATDFRDGDRFPRRGRRPAANGQLGEYEFEAAIAEHTDDAFIAFSPVAS